MLHIHEYNKSVNVMYHMLYNTCYITSNWRLHNQNGFCYVARCWLHNKKLCYIAHPNLPDANVWPSCKGSFKSNSVISSRFSCPGYITFQIFLPRVHILVNKISGGSIKAISKKNWIFLSQTYDNLCAPFTNLLWFQTFEFFCNQQHYVGSITDTN